MQNKKRILLFILFAMLGVCVTVYFNTRPQQHQEILPQKFAQLPEKPKLIAEFHHGPSIYSVAFSPTDSSLVASVDRNGTIKLWNINNGKSEIYVLSHPDSFPAIGFSPTGKLLASAGWTLILWDVASGNKINTIETTVNQFAFSPNGQQLTTLG